MSDEVLKSRLLRYVRSLPRGARTEFERYLKSKGANDRRRRTSNNTYWRELPLWLFNSYRSGPSLHDLSRTFLDEVRWGQQCLALAIKIQDDLFDGDWSSPALLFISDQLLIEADRTFSRQMERSSAFWDIYRSCLSKTTGTILEVDELQRKVVPNLKRLEIAYAGVNSLFKIAPAAICLRAKRTRDFQSASRFCDEMAIVGQILDDMRDLGEDLERERFNFVASFFLRRRNSPQRQQQLPVSIVKNLLLGGSVVDLFQILHHHLDLAERSLAILNLPDSTGFFRHYRENLRHKEGHLSRRQVDFVLNSLL